MARNDNLAFSEMFQIKWEGSKKIFDLSNVLQNFRQDEDFLDVSLVCSLSNGGSATFRAHKMVLAAYSPVFKTMFRSSDERNDPFVYLKGVSQDSLLLILDFMYQGNVNVPKSRINEFLADAQDLQIKGLKNNYEQMDLTGQGNSDKPNSNSSSKSNQTKADSENISVKNEEESGRDNVIYLQDGNDFRSAITKSAIDNLRRREPSKTGNVEQENQLITGENSNDSEAYLNSSVQTELYESGAIASNNSKLSVSVDSKENVMEEALKTRCDICEITFGRPGNYRLHKKTVHDKIKDHFCTHCNFSTGRRGTLSKHMERRHC